MSDGNLNSASDTPGQTVGQGLCNKLAKKGLQNFGPYKVHGYRSLCQESLQYDGLVSAQELCCKEGQHTECTGDEMFPHGPFHTHTHDHNHTHDHDHDHTHSHGDVTHSHPHNHAHNHNHRR
ncbi:kininogen-1-like [Portunus trituberculatus]|uniref:kininogen-1-like n=1 Tax=Portunus trituberculatus TaxID=210409 RepID=UPI001E1D0E2F|nr:kininogen-1-like [Portunus trituberculatus]